MTVFRFQQASADLPSIPLDIWQALADDVIKDGGTGGGNVRSLHISVQNKMLAHFGSKYNVDNDILLIIVEKFTYLKGNEFYLAVAMLFCSVLLFLPLPSANLFD